MPTTACGFEVYDVLFEGTATKIQGSLGAKHTTIFTLETQDTTFALTQTRRHTVCGYTLLGTDIQNSLYLKPKKTIPLKQNQRLQ
jgi:hypothetical protein